MNRAEFYAYLRGAGSRLFGSALSARQVEGIEALLDAGKSLSVDHMANVLGQVYRETGGGMYPVKETVYRHSKDQNPSDATVIKRLDTAWAKGQLPWVKSPYWRGGWFGRGQLQITHEYNYRKAAAVTGVDLVANPGAMLTPSVSAKASVEGMAAGLFTGKRLADYAGVSGYDHAGARAIVNGDGRKKDKGAARTIGEQLTVDATAFVAALQAGGWGMETAPVAPSKPSPTTPTGINTKPLWARFFMALWGILKGR
jgi:Chitinase class I